MEVSFLRKIVGVVLILIGVMVAISSFGSNYISNKSVMSNTKIDKIDFRKYEEIILTTEASDLEVFSTAELSVDMDESRYNINTIE